MCWLQIGCAKCMFHVCPCVSMCVHVCRLCVWMCVNGSIWHSGDYGWRVCAQALNECICFCVFQCCLYLAAVSHKLTVTHLYTHTKVSSLNSQMTHKHQVEERCSWLFFSIFYLKQTTPKSVQKFTFLSLKHTHTPLYTLAAGKDMFLSCCRGSIFWFKLHTFLPYLFVSPCW